MEQTFDQITRRGKIIPAKKTLSQEIKRSIYSLLFILSFIIISISITYLLNNSLTYQKGHILKVEQIKQDQLNDQKNFLIEKINQIRSLRALEENNLLKTMSRPQSIIYLNH